MIYNNMIYQRKDKVARENKTQFALLGVLMYGSFSGYQIKKMIDNSIGFFWTENYGHIYPVLSSLERKGLVIKKKIVQEKNPPKNLYNITDKGKDYFMDWLKNKAGYEKIRHELLLKVFFGSYSTSEENISKLRQEKRLHEDLLEKYENLEKHMQSDHEQRDDIKYWEMTLDFGRRYSEMVIKWCDDMTEKIEEESEDKV